ncbi:MAG: thiamine pyrophosphate-dependent enzyme [Pseudomonadota bacterium]
MQDKGAQDIDGDQRDTRHGGQILVDQLKRHGVDRVFCVPGESFLAALDGLVDSGIDLVVARQEGGAAMMAEADGKLTGRPGVLMVTRGPGATNASAGLHVAMHDATPLVAFIGQIPRGLTGRGAFQEVDFEAFFSPLVKWAVDVRDTARLPEIIARAFAVATSGRPGPVVVSLPEDMLSAQAVTPDRSLLCTGGPAPDHSAFADEVLRRLRAASRPLVIAGGPGWSQDAARDLAALSAAEDLPVAVPFRRQDYMDNRDPGFCGDLGVGMNPALGRTLSDADAVLALGTRLGETATASYTLLDPAEPQPQLIHVLPDANDLGRVYAPGLSYAAPAPAVLQALLSRSRALGSDIVAQPQDNGTRQATGDRRGARRAGPRALYEAWQTPAETPGALKLEAVIHALSDALPDTAIVTNGAGNYAAWLHRYFRFKRFGTQLAPTSGSMGYGLPAAIAAALRHRDRPVICLAGDGCLQMSVNELSTAAQYGLTLMVVVVNNRRYGTIRMHQERHYPGRVSGTDLFLPDIPALATAYGGVGETARTTSDARSAIERALGRGGLSIVELVTDPQALSTSQTLDEARAAGRHATAPS